MRYEEIYINNPNQYFKLHNKYTEAGLRLKIGQKVVCTDWALQNGVFNCGTRGIVVGYSKTKYNNTTNKNSSWNIRVLVEHRKTPGIYWAGFWKAK